MINSTYKPIDEEYKKFLQDLCRFSIDVCASLGSISDAVIYDEDYNIGVCARNHKDSKAEVDHSFSSDFAALMSCYYTEEKPEINLNHLFLSLQFFCSIHVQYPLKNFLQIVEQLLQLSCSIKLQNLNMANKIALVKNLCSYAVIKYYDEKTVTFVLKMVADLLSENDFFIKPDIELISQVLFCAIAFSDEDLMKKFSHQFIGLVVDFYRKYINENYKVDIYDGEENAISLIMKKGLTFFVNRISEKLPEEHILLLVFAAQRLSVYAFAASFALEECRKKASETEERERNFEKLVAIAWQGGLTCLDFPMRSDFSLTVPNEGKKIELQRVTDKDEVSALLLVILYRASAGIHCDDFEIATGFWNSIISQYSSKPLFQNVRLLNREMVDLLERRVAFTKKYMMRTGENTLKLSHDKIQCLSDMFFVVNVHRLNHIFIDANVILEMMQFCSDRFVDFVNNGQNDVKADWAHYFFVLLFNLITLTEPVIDEVIKVLQNQRAIICIVKNCNTVVHQNDRYSLLCRLFSETYVQIAEFFADFCKRFQSSSTSTKTKIEFPLDSYNRAFSFSDIALGMLDPNITVNLADMLDPYQTVKRLLSSMSAQNNEPVSISLVIRCLRLACDCYGGRMQFLPKKVDLKSFESELVVFKHGMDLLERGRNLATSKVGSNGRNYAEIIIASRYYLGDLSKRSSFPSEGEKWHQSALRSYNALKVKHIFKPGIIPDKLIQEASTNLSHAPIQTVPNVSKTQQGLSDREEVKVKRERNRYAHGKQVDSCDSKVTIREGYMQSLKQYIFELSSERKQITIPRIHGLIDTLIKFGTLLKAQFEVTDAGLSTEALSKDVALIDIYKLQNVIKTISNRLELIQLKDDAQDLRILLVSLQKTVASVESLLGDFFQYYSLISEEYENLFNKFKNHKMQNIGGLTNEELKLQVDTFGELSRLRKDLDCGYAAKMESYSEKLASLGKDLKEIYRQVCEIAKIQAKREEQLYKKANAKEIAEFIQVREVRLPVILQTLDGKIQGLLAVANERFGAAASGKIKTLVDAVRIAVERLDKLKQKHIDAATALFSIIPETATARELQEAMTFYSQEILLITQQLFATQLKLAQQSDTTKKKHKAQMFEVSLNQEIREFENRFKANLFSDIFNPNIEFNFTRLEQELTNEHVEMRNVNVVNAKRQEPIKPEPIRTEKTKVVQQVQNPFPYVQDIRFCITSIKDAIEDTKGAGVSCSCEEILDAKMTQNSQNVRINDLRFYGTRLLELLCSLLKKFQLRVTLKSIGGIVKLIRILRNEIVHKTQQCDFDEFKKLMKSIIDSDALRIICNEEYTQVNVENVYISLDNLKPLIYNNFVVNVAGLQTLCAEVKKELQELINNYSYDKEVVNLQRDSLIMLLCRFGDVIHELEIIRDDSSQAADERSKAKKLISTITGEAPKFFHSCRILRNFSVHVDECIDPNRKIFANFIDIILDNIEQSSKEDVRKVREYIDSYLRNPKDLLKIIQINDLVPTKPAEQLLLNTPASVSVPLSSASQESCSAHTKSTVQFFDPKAPALVTSSLSSQENSTAPTSSTGQSLNPKVSVSVTPSLTPQGNAPAPTRSTVQLFDPKAPAFVPRFSSSQKSDPVPTKPTVQSLDPKVPVFIPRS